MIIVIILIVLLILIIIGLFAKDDKDYENKNINESSSFYSSGTITKDTILKKVLIEERGNCCEECGCTGRLQVHHIIPLSKGGTNDLDNLKLICYDCHRDNHNYEFNEIGNNQRKNPPKKYADIRDAIKNEQHLIIKYKAYNNQITTREIKPININIRDGKYYLEAFCFLRNEKRKFKISRIMSVKIK